MRERRKEKKGSSTFIQILCFLRSDYDPEIIILRQLVYNLYKILINFGKKCIPSKKNQLKCTLCST